MFCIHCGQAGAATDEFCAHCGRAVPPEVRAAVEPPPPDPSHQDEPDLFEPDPKPPHDRRHVVWGVLAAIAVMALGGIATSWVWRERESVPAVATVPAPVPTPTAAPAPAEPATRFDPVRLGASVLTLHVFNGNGEETTLGSGFIVGAGGLAVTSLHVIKDGATIRATTGAGALAHVTRVVHVDQVNDLVTLQLESDTPGVTFTPLTPADPPGTAPGQRVYTISAAQGFSNTVSDGLLSGVRDVNGVQLLQISAPISAGSSGGPVFNEQGNVIGVIGSQLTAGQQLNFATPIAALVRLINGPEVSPAGPPPTADAESAAPSKADQ